MAETVQSDHEISLNSLRPNSCPVRYPIVGQVQRGLSSSYPEKTVIGDYTQDSSPILSTLSLTDHRGGIGLDVMTGQGDTDRSWYSTADTRWRGHLVLPPLVTNTSSLPSGLSAIHCLASYKGTVHAAVTATSSGLEHYTGSAWSQDRADSDAVNAEERWTTAEIAGVSYLVIGGTDRFWYWNGSAWTERVVGATGGWMAFWDDRIWGVILGGVYTLWYTLALGSGETILGSTPVAHPSVKVGRLFVGRDVSGEHILYLALPIGLYAYDVANDKWHETGLQLPDNAGADLSNWASAVVWRDDIYFATRSTILKYSVGNGRADISSIGPDRDHGPASGGQVRVDHLPLRWAREVAAVAGG